MTMHNRILGQRGERLAEQHLTEQGAHLLTRNYRIPFGEIDLVMEHEGELVAVEVKTRAVTDLEKPEEAITGRKLSRIAHALTAYACDTGHLESPWRIDMVAIEIAEDESVLRVDHLRGIYPA